MVTGVQLSKQVIGGVNVVVSVIGQLLQTGITCPTMPIADIEAGKVIIEQYLQRLCD